MHFKILLLVITTVLLTIFAQGCSEHKEPLTESSVAYISSPILGETDDMGQSYIDSIIFVGDSNTAHLVNFGVLSGGQKTEQVWIPNGSTITLDTEITHKSVYCHAAGGYMTIPQAAAFEKPEYLIISIGTNGIAALDEHKFKYCYGSLLDALKEASPTTAIMVQSIYPVTSDYKSFTNETVERANEWLIELAAEYDIKYIDTASVLKDETGALRKEYNADHKDGYHINKKAAEKIIEYIRTHGYIKEQRS